MKQSKEPDKCNLSSFHNLLPNYPPHCVSLHLHVYISVICMSFKCVYGMIPLLDFPLCVL